MDLIDKKFETKNNLSKGLEFDAVLICDVSADNVAGITGAIFDWCEKICPNIRIDTHRDNRIMQRVLTKNGFTYFGLIYLKSGAERLAYQRVGKK